MYLPAGIAHIGIDSILQAHQEPRICRQMKHDIDLIAQSGVHEWGQPKEWQRRIRGDDLEIRVTQGRIELGIGRQWTDENVYLSRGDVGVIQAM
jgi:hypothetical protein